MTNGILAIRRAERYSPNSVEKDAAILDDVSQTLRSRGVTVDVVSEEECRKDCFAHHNMYMSMGRNPQTLEWLKEREQNGATVINSSESVSLCCHRARLNNALRQIGTPLPYDGMGEKGCWVKRGDGVAETKEDIRFAANASEMTEAVEAMKANGASSIVIQAHEDGDLVKFYGVTGADFFRTYYPGDDGMSKFGDEERNGKPQHYSYDAEALRSAVERAAIAIGTEVYGGDCIIRHDGSFCIIDFNDWPSFSRCRTEAAEVIAQIVERKYKVAASGKEQTT